MSKPYEANIPFVIYHPAKRRFIGLCEKPQGFERETWHVRIGSKAWIFEDYESARLQASKYGHVLTFDGLETLQIEAGETDAVSAEADGIDAAGDDACQS